MPVRVLHLRLWWWNKWKKPLNTSNRSKYNKECDANAERNLQLRVCSAVDRIQFATDSCMKKKVSVHAHIHNISIITGIPLTQLWKMLHYDGFYPYYFLKVWSLLSKIAVYNFVNGCNHGYKFCVIFYTWMRFNLHVITLIIEPTVILWCSKIHKKKHKVLFSWGF